MGYKILLADDSVTVQKIIALTFSDEGVEVVTVNDGDEALACLQYMKPSLIMADVSIPGKNGYEICEHVKTHPDLKEIPVILLVPAFEPFDQERAKRIGANHHLTKPFQSIRTLISTVKSLIEPGLTTGQSGVGEAILTGTGDLLTEDFTATLQNEHILPSPVRPEEAVVSDVKEDGDHILDLDDVLSDFPVPVETLTDQVAASVSRGAGQATAAEPGPSSAIPQNVIDEIVTRVVEQLSARLADNLSRDIAQRIAPEVADILRAERSGEKIAYGEPGPLLELDEA